MAKNGVLQLKKLIISFCDISGSSQGVRYCFQDADPISMTINII